MKLTGQAFEHLGSTNTSLRGVATGCLLKFVEQIQLSATFFLLDQWGCMQHVSMQKAVYLPGAGEE